MKCVHKEIACFSVHSVYVFSFAMDWQIVFTIRLGKQATKWEYMAAKQLNNHK